MRLLPPCRARSLQESQALACEKLLDNPISIKSFLKYSRWIARIQAAQNPDRMQRVDRRWIRVGFGLAIVLAGATHAEARLVSTGIGPFYDGIGHFLLSPEDIIPAIALALLAGMRGPTTGGWALWTLPAAWFAGGLVGMLSHTPLYSEEISSGCSFLVFGALIAADLALSLPLVVLLAFSLGGLHGFFNGLALREAGSTPALLQLTGIGLMLFLVVLHISELVQSLKRPWTRIVVRVMGSWIAASGLLLLAGY
jgi:urease accessory protein